MSENNYLSKIFKATPSPSLLLMADPPHFTITDANNAYLKTSGEKESGLIGKSIFELFPGSPGDTTGETDLRQSLSNAVSTHASDIMPTLKISIPIAGTDQYNIRYWDIENIPVLDDGGEISVIIHSVTDVTEKKRKDQKQNLLEQQALKTQGILENNLATLNKIVDTSLDVICAVDANGCFTYVSAAAESVWGYTPDRMIGKKLFDFVAPEDHEKTNMAAAGVMAGNNFIGFENRYIRKDGSVVPIAWSSRWDATDQIRYSVARDITDKKRLEKAFEIESQRFQDLFLHAPSCMGILRGPNYIFEMANPLYLQLIGKKDIIGKELKEILPEISEQGIIAILDRVYQTGETFSANEMLVRIDKHNNGKPEDMYLNFIYQAFKDDAGNIDSIFFFAIDVTEQVLSRKKIEESEEQYRRIVETAMEGIWVIDENDRTNFVNQKMCDMIEYSAAELLGREMYHFMDDGSRKKSLEQSERRKQGVSESHDLILVTKSGRNVWVNISTNSFLDAAGNYTGALIMMTDITERKRAEQEMIWLVNNTEECFILLNHDLKIVSFNKQFQQLYSRYLGVQVAKGDCILDYAQPERRAVVQEIYTRVLLGTEEYGEIKIPLPDASEKNFAIKYKPAKNDQGEIIGAFVSVIDITEKKKMEKLQEFEKRDKEALINTTEDLIWTVGSDFRLIAANHAFLNGIKKKTGIALSPGDDLMHNGGHTPEFLKLWEGLYNKALAGNSFIKEFYTPASELYPESWAETRFNPIYDGDMITGIACYWRDTTASRSFQNRLMDINKKLENAQQTAQLGYWELSMDRRTLHWSGEVYKIWGVAQETFQTNYEVFLASIHPDDREQFEVNQKNAFEGKGKLDVEQRIILADGTLKYVHEKGELIYNDQGNPIHFEGTVQDITERKKTESVLIKRGNQLILAAEMARLGYWEQDIIKGIFTFTDEFYAIFKTTAEKVGGYTMSAARYAELFIHPDDREIVAKSVAESIRSSDAKFSFKTEHRIIYATGEIGHVSVHFYIVKDDRGRTIKNFGVNQDITERKKAEEEIKEINQRFKYVTKATSDAIWDWDLLNQTIYWGEGFETIFGYKLDGIKTDISSWTDHIHPQDIERVMKKVLAFIEGTEMKWEDQYRFCRQDQTYVHVVDKGFIIRDAEGKAIRMVGSLRDITKKKNEEFALQQSEARHQGIIASQTNYVIRTDLVGNYTYYNQKFLDDFGWIYPNTNLIGMSFMESNMDYHHQFVIDTVEKCFATMNQVFQVEIDKPKKNGGIITTLWEFICLSDSGGQPTEIQCMGIDISERKKAQLAVIDTLKEKNTILESIGDAFFAVDKNWIVTYWNSKAETMLGKTKKQVVGNHLWEVFSDSIDSQSDKKYRQALQSGQVVQFEDYYPAQSKWYEISAYPSDSGLSVYCKDISERKFSEIQLTDLNGNIRKNAKKLAESNAELEQFAYVASHDLQEPLRMVTSYLTQIEKKYGGVIDDRGKKYIHFAVDGAKRMRQIILDLLEFSRVGRTDDDIENIDLNELIREIQILYIKQIAEKNATLVFDSLPVMHAHRSPLRQVFQNIIGNALKYTRKDVPVHIYITAQELQNHWQFAIADNGIGIEKEYFDKIFVIFQRLHHKDEFSGTGIGLAVTKKIIENLGGKIWVESTEGEGSTFYFTLAKQT